MATRAHRKHTLACLDEMHGQLYCTKTGQSTTAPADIALMGVKKASLPQIWTYEWRQDPYAKEGVGQGRLSFGQYVLANWHSTQGWSYVPGSEAMVARRKMVQQFMMEPHITNGFALVRRLNEKSAITP